MSKATEILAERVDASFKDVLRPVPSTCGELTYELDPDQLVEVCARLKGDEDFGFEQLIDICGVDYLSYGDAEWQTMSATASGFSRGVSRAGAGSTDDDSRRFAVVYHLLSVAHNWRMRLRVFVPSGDVPIVDTVTGIWPGANWFEREAFDLLGILFRGHPDLRRILTDYGFIGHPFRKDFPLSGNVEVRYDPVKKRVVYQPVSIEPRTLVPRVIRDDHRYADALNEEAPGDD